MALLEQARARAVAERVDLEGCKTRDYWVDGMKIRTMPPDRAALVQRVRHDGTVEWSGYLPAGVTPPTCKKPVLVPALEVGTVLAAASAATLFAVAAVERNEALEVASRIDAGETVLPGDLGDCASHLESGDSAGRAAWSRCVGRAYDETYVTPVNTLGYAAEGAAGVAVVLGGAALVFSVQW